MALKTATRWAKSERGNIAILFGLMLPLVVGGAAYGVETTYWYLTRLQLQSEADAAAMAGAMDARSGYTTTLTATATKGATDNGFAVSSGTIAVNYPPTSGPSGPNAVEVILTTNAQRFFTSVFTNTAVPVKARAVAKFMTAGSACVLALNATASSAARFWGSSHLTLTGCDVMANSISNSAIAVGGSGYLAADCLFATGGISVDSGSHTTCAQNQTGASPVGDPYKDVPVPANGTTYNNDSANPLQPGYYPNGITIGPNKTVTFAPGTYVIDNTFKLNNNSVVSCTGCTFYMKGNSTIDWNGGATENFQAPTTGTYAGMLLMGDRTNTATQTFNGNNTSHLTGAVYFKKAAVKYNGNYSGLNGCLYVVGDTVDWSGNTTVNVDCTVYGMLPIPAAYSVKLAE
jgi:Flp pilus assembly protein TadG